MCGGVNYNLIASPDGKERVADAPAEAAHCCHVRPKELLHGTQLCRVNGDAAAAADGEEDPGIAGNTHERQASQSHFNIVAVRHYRFELARDSLGEYGNLPRCVVRG